MTGTSVFAIAMEAMMDGKPKIEKEITCYVKLKDLYDVISIAKDSETHEQWQVMTDSKKGNMRIRLTDDVEYSMTVKEKTKRQFESMETEQLITKECFEVLRRSFAFDGYLKTRYNIPVEGTDRKWEVDVFKNHKGTASLWIKLDYEFAEGENSVPEIPFDYNELIIPELDSSKEEQVTLLWEEEWAKIDEDE